MRYVCIVCGHGGASAHGDKHPPLTYNCCDGADGGCGGKATMWPVAQAEQYMAVQKQLNDRDAEVDRLNGMLAASSDLFRTKQRVNRELQSELTKARELILKLADKGSQVPGFPSQLMREARLYLANQSAPAALNQAGEQL